VFHSPARAGDILNLSVAGVTGAPRNRRAARCVTDWSVNFLNRELVNR
jgi:hypothetical protein